MHRFCSFPRSVQIFLPSYHWRQVRKRTRAKAPRSPLFGGTGLWGQRLGLQPEVGVPVECVCCSSPDP